MTLAVLSWSWLSNNVDCRTVKLLQVPLAAMDTYLSVLIASASLDRDLVVCDVSLVVWNASGRA